MSSHRKKQTTTKKVASPMFQRIWSEDDELALLKGLVDFGGSKTDKLEWDAFFNSLQGTLHGHFSKEQVVSKVQKLKKKFTRRPMDTTHPLFPYATLLWAPNTPPNDEKATESLPPTVLEEEEDPVQLPNAPPSNENLPPAVLEQDLQDAFDTLLSHGLSDFKKQLQLQRLLNMGTRKRKELGDEWRALCVEEARLNLKKLRFSLKLAEAATD